MKILNSKTVALLATLLVSFSFFSCVNQIQDDSGIDADEKVTVNISFSGFNFSYDEDDVTTRADQTAAEAAVNRIALAVLDKDGKIVFSSKKNATVDTEDFDKISCELLLGDYTFVAVAHKASADTEEAADITSSTVATITSSKVLKTFAAVQPVTIVRGDNTVNLAFGKRITSTFQLYTTDETPAEVASCEITLKPAGSTTTTAAYKFDPSTGFTSETYQNKVEFLRSNSETGTFQNMALNVHCFLKENPQTITVAVVMKDASGNEVKSYTFNDVSMAPHRTTRATGKFFHASAGGSFTFDNSDDTTVDVPF